MRPFKPDKILNHLDRVLEWKDSNFTTPITIEFDMTNSCNNFCPWCFGYNGLNRRDKETWVNENVNQRWDLGEAKDLLEQLKDYGIRGIMFTGGGEPLVNDSTIPAIEYAFSLGLDVALITNGNKLNKDSVKSILESCVWCRISLDATDQEEYLKEHGVKCWDRVLNNIRTLVSTKKELKSKCTIGIGYLTKSFNDKILEFSKLGKELGVDYSQFRPLLTDYGINNKYTVELIQTASRIYSTSNYKVVCSEQKYNRIINRDIYKSYNLCHGRYFATTISADHRVYVCCHMRGIEKYCLGDLRSQSFKEIWESETNRNMDSIINVHCKDCLDLCRNDGFNRTLENLVQEPTHKNFL